MNSKKYLTSLAVLACLLLGVSSAKAAGTASMTLSPSSGSYQVGKTFQVSVLVNPGQETIDMVRANLNFSSDLLTFEKFSPAGAFTYQAGSNGGDNQSGSFSWGAGTPGGISSPVTFGVITFLVKKEGKATVSVQDSSLLLSGGENKFNGRLSSVSYTLLPLTLAKNPTAKNPQHALQPEKVIATSNQDSSPATSQDEIATQVIPNTPSKGTSSLADSLVFPIPFRVIIFVLAIILGLLLVVLGYRLFYKPYRHKY